MAGPEKLFFWAGLEIKRISPSTECLMMTARDETQLAVACLQRGAYDYLVKPMSSDDFSSHRRAWLAKKNAH